MPVAAAPASTPTGASASAAAPAATASAPPADGAAAPAAKKKKTKSAAKKKKKKTGVADAVAKPKRQAAVKRSGARGESWPPTESSSIFGGIFDPGPAIPSVAVADPDDEGDATKSNKGKKVTDAPADEDQLQDDQQGSTGWSLFASGEPDLGADLALGRPTLSPANIEPLKRAIARYQAIVAAGGWPTVPKVQMASGSSGEAVSILRKRLEIEGDLAGGSFFGDSSFDGAMEDAVRRFQVRNGLISTGDLLDSTLAKNGTRTLNALNVPASSRLKQLKTNLARIQSFAKTANQRYVMVNIPAQEIEAVSGGMVDLRLVGVVGKPDPAEPAAVLRHQPAQVQPDLDGAADSPQRGSRAEGPRPRPEEPGRAREVRHRCV